MRKTILTILGALLITGSAVQMAAATNYHVTGQGHAHSDFRRSYNQVNQPFYAAPLTSAQYRNLEDFGVSAASLTLMNRSVSAARPYWTYLRCPNAAAQRARTGVWRN